MKKFHIDFPARVLIDLGAGWRDDAGRVTVSGGAVRVSSGAPVTGVRLVYETSIERGAKVFGDAWERGYGELEWRGMVHERLLPWYAAIDEGGVQSFIGAMTGCAAFVGFYVLPRYIVADIDTRSGEVGVNLENRELVACTLLADFNAEMSAYSFLRGEMRKLCPAPRLTERPVYGGNNWYYAYGKSSREDILRDTAFIARLTGGLENRPYMVIDDGWQKHSPEAQCNGGPWVGCPAFGDMGALARDMADMGVRPGIWIRPLFTAEEPPKGWATLSGAGNWTLDPSNPEVIEHIKETAAELRGMGYELIKHDFSTFDTFGKWGSQVIAKGMYKAHPMADNTRTTAEILRNLYAAIAEAAGDAVIIGCNTVGHLAAGINQLQRTGDDTSGKNWERTRRMGVNTLAMRMIQHRAFFDCDADCAPLTSEIDAQKALMWLDLLAKSGTPLFVSARPGSLSAKTEETVREALARASVFAPPAEPMDWQETTCPGLWNIDGRIEKFELDEPYFAKADEVWWHQNF